MGITVIVAPTEAQARAKHAEYLRHASPEAGVAHFASSTGIDFAAYGLDEPIGFAKGNAIQSATRQLQDNVWTRRRLLQQHALGGRYVTLVGAPEQVAEQLIDWIDQTGLDGFNLTRTVTPESFEDFIDRWCRSCNGVAATRPPTAKARCAKTVRRSSRLPSRRPPRRHLPQPDPCPDWSPAPCLRNCSGPSRPLSCPWA